MTRAAAALALLAAACASTSRTPRAEAAAPTGGPASPTSNEAFAQHGADLQKTLAALERARASCAPLRTAPTPLPEELAAGELLAGELALHGRGAFVELSPDVSPEARWGARRPRPPRGPKADLSTWVNLVGKYVAGASERPGLPWTFVVLDLDAPQTFSTPGGYVFVTTGLLRLIENEAQLAGALAHEVAHVSGRHHLPLWREAVASACFAAVAVESVSREFPAARFDALPLSGDQQVALGMLTPEKRAMAARELMAMAEGMPWRPQTVSQGLLGLFSNVAGHALQARGHDGEQELAAEETAAALLVFSGYNPAEYEKLLAKLPADAGATARPKVADRLKRLVAARQRWAAFSPDTLAAPPCADQLVPLKP